MRKWLLKFNVNFSIRENGYENDYTTVGKQLKSYINCCFSVQYGTVKANMLWMLFVQKKNLENNFTVGVEPCLKTIPFSHTPP